MGLYIILMGVQGAGKGEQAKFIQQTYGIPQVSTGDLFRAMRTRTDALAQRIQHLMSEGLLIDDDTTNEVLVDRLAQPDVAQGAIFDGYPRNAAQADFLADYLAKKGEKISTVLLLDLDLYTAFKRAFGRMKAASGDTYNYYYRNDGVTFDFEKHPEGKFPPRMTGKIVATGETLERRPDDADAVAVIKRIDLYMADTQPLIDYYTKNGLLKRIHADQPIDAVSTEMKKLIDGVKPK
jgi:adenylate kinase